MKTTRRGFLGLLAALGAAAAAGESKSREVLLDEFFVAGFRFHQGPGLLWRMRPGQKVGIANEKNNPYDAHAVRLFFEGRCIGFVPRSRNLHISRLLEGGADLRCEIAGVNPSAAPWEQVRVRVSLASPRG